MAIVGVGVGGRPLKVLAISRAGCTCRACGKSRMQEAARKS